MKTQTTEYLIKWLDYEAVPYKATQPPTRKAVMIDKIINSLLAAQEMADILTEIVYALGDRCYYDHHGNCQAHFVSNPCPVEVAKQALSKWEKLNE